MQPLVATAHLSLLKYENYFSVGSNDHYIRYTLGAKVMWPVYAIAGAAGLISMSAVAYFFWHKPRQQRARSCSPLPPRWRPTK